MSSNKKEDFSNSLEKALNHYSYKNVDNSCNTIKLNKYSTGIYPLDRLLDGGFPQGRIVSFGAEPGVGKTTLLLQACGNIVRTYNKNVYYMDTEGGATFELISSMNLQDIWYSEKTNPNGKLFLLKVSAIQEIANLIKILVKDPNTALIIIDTATAVVDQRVLDDPELGTNSNVLGQEARMWSNTGKYIQSLINDTEISLVLTHQARVDLSFHRPRTVSAGGKALRHMPSIEIWGRIKHLIDYNFEKPKDMNEAYGSWIELKTFKNRIKSPFQSVELPLMYGRGVSDLFIIKDWLTSNHPKSTLRNDSEPYLSQKSSWYYFEIPEIGLSERLHSATKVWDFILKNKNTLFNFIKQHS